MTLDAIADLHARAAEVAAATGVPVILGVRPHNGSVFVHCDNVEHDGSTWADALDGVAKELARRARSRTAEAEATIRAAGKVLALTSPSPTETTDER